MDGKASGEDEAEPGSLPGIETSAACGGREQEFGLQ
jgi:hypothetical protein